MHTINREPETTREEHQGVTSKQAKQRIENWTERQKLLSRFLQTPRTGANAGDTQFHNSIGFWWNFFLSLCAVTHRACFRPSLCWPFETKLFRRVCVYWRSNQVFVNKTFQHAENFETNEVERDENRLRKKRSYLTKLAIDNKESLTTIHTHTSDDMIRLIFFIMYASLQMNPLLYNQVVLMT